MIFLFRYQLMRGAGNFLVRDDAPSNGETIFVLSGAPQERAAKAAELFQKKFCKKIICTGANRPQDFLAMGFDMTEAGITRRALLQLNVPDSCIALLEEGTSTLEESDAVLKYCEEKKLKQIEIVSSKFHTRRVRNVFVEKFSEKNIEVKIIGASAISFDENKWWESEYGLLALNNEYVKLMYYWFK
jgi:uncharacterized SAM-binding protein YcdF (DUF218 family)